MDQSDIFEFKPLNNLVSPINKLGISRKNQALKQCKEVIRQLYEALLRQQSQHNVTKNNMKKIQQKNTNFLKQISALQTKIKDISQQKQSKQSRIKDLEKQCQQMHEKQYIYIQQQNKYNQLMTQLNTCNQKAITQNQRNTNQFDSLRKKYHKQQAQINTMRQTINLLTQQNQELKDQVILLQQQKQNGVKQLLILNQTMKKKYRDFSENYGSPHQQHVQSIYPTISVFHGEISAEKEDSLRTNDNILKKSASCEKKKQFSNISETNQKRINKFMSDTHENCIRTPIIGRNRSASNTKIHRQRVKNPELLDKRYQINNKSSALNQQIKHIKQQITQQYSLMSLKQEAYSKQRVENTLEQLKNKVNHFIKKKLDDSD